MKHLLYSKIVLIFLFSFQNGFSISITKQKKIQDSIITYIKRIDDKSLPIKRRLLFNDLVYKYSIQSKNDSLKNETLKQYIKLYYKQKKWKQFHKFRREHLQLTLNLKDSSSHANTLEYSGAYFMNHHKVDSAYQYYYRSYRIFNKLKDSLKAGRILINLATLQKRGHDYVGSEETSFKAITYLKSSHNLRRISSAYNNLGLIYEQLDDLDNAIKYHTKSFDLRKQIKNPLYQTHSLNNIGLVYTKNRVYKKAISYFKKALTFDSILQEKQIIKAYILDNYTYARFKKGEVNNILKSFLEALSIRERENHKAGIIINCIHLAEYYNKIGDIKVALTYAKRAEKISKSIGNYQDYLKAIELLSSIYDTKEAKNLHFKKYIAIRDSLDRVGRNHKEQFARIRFETREKEKIIQNQENEIEEKKNIILIVFGVITLIIISLIVFYSKKRRTQQKLKKEFTQGFEFYIKKKYKLTNQNFEFWKILAKGLDQNNISKELSISIEAIKSRRRSLKDKINKIEKTKDNFNKTKASLLYTKEVELFKKTLRNK